MPRSDCNDLIDDWVVYVIPFWSFFPPPTLFFPFQIPPPSSFQTSPPSEEDSDEGQHHKMPFISTMSPENCYLVPCGIG